MHDTKSQNLSEIEDKSSEDIDEAFEPNFELKDQIQDYYKVSDTFRRNRLHYEDKWLKRAIIYDNKIAKDKEMPTQETRYPSIQKSLDINPFYEPKKEKKKKKKS